MASHVKAAVAGSGRLPATMQNVDGDSINIDPILIILVHYALADAPAVIVAPMIDHGAEPVTVHSVTPVLIVDACYQAGAMEPLIHLINVRLRDF